MKSFLQHDSSKIEKIEIVKNSEAITLEKVNGVWMMTKPANYPADTSAIFPMLFNPATVYPGKCGIYQPCKILYILTV